MEVKPGYEQTEIGVIPEDWKVMPFIQAVGSYIDYRGRTPRKLGLSWGGGDILALSANNVQMGRIDPDKEAYFGSEELYRKWMIQGECEAGDVLLTMEAPLGNVAQIPDSKRYILSQRVLLIKPRNWLHRDFLTHYMKGFVFQKQLSLNSTGSTAKGIQRRTLDNISIGLPPTKAEQETIAEALGDADALIESLERLVAKKRQLKQGAMQELLTGSRRLPGFSGEWEVKRWGNLILSCSSGATPYRGRPDFYKGGIKWITSGELNYKVIVDTLEHISTEAMAKTNLRIHPTGTFLMAITGLEAEGTRGACGFVGSPATTNQSCMAIYPSSDLLPEYLYHYYVYRGDALALEYCQGTKQQSYTARLIRILPIDLPPTVAEQAAIAGALSDMDAEIDELNTRLAKARQLKQGMMQELLTGKIRLV